MLFHCIECNEKISSRAKVCPHCGYPDNISDRLNERYDKEYNEQKAAENERRGKLS
jgi:ribosomal protein L37E